MKKNLIILLLSLLIIIIILIVFFLSIIEAPEDNLSSFNLDTKASLILFSDETCLPCQEVENYIDDNNLENSLNLSVINVHNSLTNTQQFEEKFDECISPPRTYGVPLLWHEGNCILGPIEIIDYLNRY